MPGATLTYDVRPGELAGATPLFLTASPMGAAGFGTLAGHFTDRTVVTYDPPRKRAQPADRADYPTDAASSTPTTCTGSSKSSVAGRSTCSRAVAAR